MSKTSDEICIFKYICIVWANFHTPLTPQDLANAATPIYNQ